ncbi:MAG TPA: TolC family protein, partial [Bryobacteraceae bacterium]|nr:TolC family protein [Bryobacteraceae bacterium]
MSATERQVAIREQGVRVARSAFLPTVSVQTVYAGQAFPQGLFDFTGLRWQPDWTASVSIQLPIFTGFRRQAEMAQAKVELRRAELQLTQLR